MIVRDRLAQRAETGGEVIELSVMFRKLALMRIEARDNRIELAVLRIELVVVPGNPAGNLGEQLIDGCDIGAVDAALPTPRAILARALLYTHFSPHQRKRLSPS